MIAGCACCAIQSRPPANGGERNAAAFATVCGISEKPAHYDGKFVEVRGIYWQGALNHFCPGPSRIDLIETTGYKGTDRLEFATDRKSFDALNALFIRQAQAGLHGEIWATISGKLLTGSVRDDSGHAIAPALLIVHSVTATEVSTNPTYDYGAVFKLSPR